MSPRQEVVREGNLWYPLPADYPELSLGGQREARVWVVSRQNTPEETVHAWDFLRTYYLCATPGDTRLPEGFFYRRRLPSPPAHYRWIRDIAMHQLCAFAAPRYSAKSVVIGTELPILKVLPNHFYRVLLMLSKDEYVEERLEYIQYQLEENPLILDDFGCVKPEKGKATWNKHYMILNNRASIRGASVEGKVRGQHPDLLILDDVEQDLIQLADIDKFLGKLENLLFVVACPMLDAGSKMAWVGTLDHLRSFLYWVCTSED